MGRKCQEFKAHPCYLEKLDPNILRDHLPNIRWKRICTCSSSIMLVSSNLKLPHHSHIKIPGSLSLQEIMPCRADTRRLQLKKKKKWNSMKQAPKVQGWIGYISLPYISDLLSSELDFVFLEELSAQEREKRREI